MTAPICLWSGPRNVSTALMYSFAQRADMRVVDEPLYGHYLRVSGAEHPGRDEVMKAQDCDGNRVMQHLLNDAQRASKKLFFKHMAHHLVDLDLAFLGRTQNVFLIRAPREMLPSLSIQLPHATVADTGLKQQWELFERLSQSGSAPAVLDSQQLLLTPEHVLQQLCRHLDIEFDAAMLTWNAGARNEDGVWAKYWYHAVHKSTGFAAYTAKTAFPSNLCALLRDCEPWYEKLFQHAIRAKKDDN